MRTLIKETFGKKKFGLALFFAIYFSYWFFFPLIYERVGEPTGLVTAVIIGCFGFFYGIPFGLGSAILFFPLNYFLYTKTNSTISSSPLAPLFTQSISFAIGYFSGALRSLILKIKTQKVLLENEGLLLKKEVENRISAEEKLLKLSNNLESIVDKRTEELKKSNQNLINEINKRKFIQDKLENHINFEKLISSISKHVFYFNNNLDDDINFILTQIGINTASDNCYLYRFNENKQLLINTHIWSNNTTFPISKKGQNIFIDNLPWLKDILFYSENIFIKDVNDLPEEAINEKELFNNYSIKSFIAVPFYYNGILDGFIGLDYRKDYSFYNDDELKLLTTISELLSVAIQKNKIEEKLLDNENYLKFLFDSVHTGIAIIDAETHTILDVNEYSTKMFGVSKDNMIGRLCHQYICPAQIGACPITDLCQSVDLSEKVMTDYFGNRIPILKSVVSAKRNNNTILIESFTDITNLKKTEAALRESEEKLKIIFNSISDVIYSLAQDFTIISINSSIERILGYKESEVIGKKIDELGVLTPDSLQKAINYSRRIFNREILPSITLEFIARDGSIRIGEVISTLATINSQPISIAVARDVTDRIEAEKKLSNINSELLSLNNKLSSSEVQLKELNISKDKFFSIISHDLRSPFMGLLGLSSLLKDDYNNLVDSERVFIVDSINRSIKKIFDLLDNLLQWSKIQTGSIQYSPERIYLKELIKKTTELFEANIYQKTISLTIDVDDNIYVFADINSLQSILQNLISNAVKFTYPAGKIEIKAVQIENMIQIEISDSGVGLSDDEIIRLFKIDEQFTTLGTNEEAGSGLGLILCKEHVIKNGGQIWVKSKVGVGTTFYFTLKNAE